MYNLIGWNFIIINCILGKYYHVTIINVAVKIRSIIIFDMSYKYITIILLI